MYKAKTTINSEHAQKYLTVLCRHFKRKVPASWDETQGRVEFPIGLCMMSVTGNSLDISCEADSENAISGLKKVLEAHIQMFNRREELYLEWQ